MTLKDFEDHPVASCTLKVTKVGEGLSEALLFDPQQLPYGSEVYLVVRGTVTGIDHRPIPKLPGYLIRSHTVEASQVAMVDRKAVEAMLRAETDRVARMADEAAGVSRLELED